MTVAFYQNSQKENSRDNNWQKLDIIKKLDLVAYVFTVTGEMLIEAGNVRDDRSRDWSDKSAIIIYSQKSLGDLRA